jgi:predicted aspartyl protease
MDGANRKAQRANLDGTKMEDLITMGLSAPGAIALDVTEARSTGRMLGAVRSNGRMSTAPAWTNSSYRIRAVPWGVAGSVMVSRRRRQDEFRQWFDLTKRRYHTIKPGLRLETDRACNSASWLGAQVRSKDRRGNPLLRSQATFTQVHKGHVLIDTGALRGILLPQVIQRLGLEMVGERVAEYADGRLEAVGLTEPLTLQVLDREELEEAMVVGEEVLIGRTALGKLGLVVDYVNQRLVPNRHIPISQYGKSNSVPEEALCLMRPPLMGLPLGRPIW